MIKSLIFLCTLALFFGATGPASATLIGPTPYLSVADSPFSPFGPKFYLEDFEDGFLNTPGVISAGDGDVIDSITYPVYAGSIDSVGGDGTTGHSFFNLSEKGTIRFEFNPATTGFGLPTHVGIVWTDGFGQVAFEAFDDGGLSLGTIVVSLGVASQYTGEADEDRFFGVSGYGGISAIEIRMVDSGIEVDHLQYGVVPEPTTLLLLGLGLIGLAGLSRRKFLK